MQPKFVCSKCGQRGFRTINDLETHIVKEHFSNVNSLYKCWFSGCSERFATEVDRLKHMDHKQHDGLLKMFMQMQDEGFVALRLVINNCLNESINLSFSRLYELNGNNSEGPAPVESSGMRLIGMASTALQRPARTSLERRRQTQQNFYDSNEAGKKRSPVSKLPKPRLENSGLNDENNKKIELENAQMSYVVKDEPSLIDELAETVSVHSNDGSGSASLQPKRSRIEISHEISSKPSVVKDEPSLMDELASIIPVTSDQSDTLTVRNIGKLTPALKRSPQRQQNLSNPAINLDCLYQLEGVTSSMAASSSMSKTRMEISEPNNEKNMRIEPENSSRSCVVKVMNPGPKFLTVPQMKEIVKANEQGTRKSDIAKMFDTSLTTVYRVLDQYRSEGYHKQLIENAFEKDVWQSISELNNENNVMIEPENSSRSCLVKVGKKFLKVKLAPLDLAIPSNDSIDKGNERVEPATSSKLSLVKEEPFGELAARIPLLSNRSDGLAVGNSEPSASKPAKPRMEILSEQNNKLKNTEHENSILVKDEPSLVEELSTTLPAPSNHNGLLIPLNRACITFTLIVISESAPPPQKTKRSRKQNFADLHIEDNKGTQPRTSSSLSVVKDEPNFPDELAADMPGPSNHYISISNNDEIRILRDENVMTTPKPRRKRKQLTSPEKRIILNARAQGHSYAEIATLADCSVATVSHVIANYRKTDSIARKTRVYPRRLSPQMEGLLDRKLNENSKYTAKQGAQDLTEAYGISVSRRMVSDVMKRKVISTDSDDEVRIVTAPKRPRAPNSGMKVGSKCLTTPQMQAIVKANEQGTKKCDIAKIFDTSLATINRVLDVYKTEGTVKRKPGGGRKKKTTPEIERFIVNSCENDVWLSASEAVIAVKKKFGVEISDNSVLRIRHKNGLVGHRLKDEPGSLAI